MLKMKLKQNIILFYIINFLQACVFLIPIWYFFFVNYLNFWIWDAILITTLPWLISMFFEIHSWWWADRFWRKSIYIIWILSWLFWFSFYLWADKIYLFLISAFFLWIYFALTSWNLEALIHDSLEEEWNLKEYSKIQSNQYILLFIWRWISSLLAWYLFFYNEYYPIIATIAVYIIATILVFFIHSPKQELSEESSDLKHIKKAFIFLKENKKMIFLIISVWFIISWIWNIYRFTYQPYLEEIWINIKEIWIIYFLISAFSAFWSYIIKNIIDKISTFKIITFLYIVLIIVSFMFSYFKNIFWIVPILILSVIFWFLMILWNTYLIKHSPKTHKSTILSIFSLSVSIWYFSMSAISWYIAQIYSLEKVYTAIPFIIIAIFFIWIIYFKNIDKKII